MTAAQVKALVDPVLALESEVEASSTKTIEVGQTPAEVETVLGTPDTVIKLGPKVTYVYQGMKIIFTTDGKVTDVQ